jgi:hypothetical protein
MKTKHSRASALLLATILLFAILTVIISLSSVTVMEMKMGQKGKSSVASFYDAESGVEWALHTVASSNGNLNTVFNSTNGNAPATDGSVACPSGITSTGCKVYFLKADGTAITQTDFTTLSFADVRSVRSIGQEGNETQRAIEAAVAGSNCRTGFTDTGYGYCITNQQSDLGYEEASQYCATQYKGRLCSMSEWLNACVNDKGDFANQASFQTPVNPGARQEIIGDMIEVNRIMAFTPKNCKLDVASHEEVAVNDPWPFHCCRDYESH